MTVRWLDRHTIRAPHLTLCLDQQQYDAALNHLKVPSHTRGLWVSAGSHATTHTFTCDDKVCCVVCLDDSHATDGIDIAALLAHEAVHVYQELVESIGERKPGAEFMAYTVQNVVEELMREYARQKGLA